MSHKDLSTEKDEAFVDERNTNVNAVPKCGKLEDGIFIEESEETLEESASESNSVRLVKLRKAIESIIQKCISGIRYRKFVESLPMLKESNQREIIKRVHAQLKDQLAASIKTEVDLLLAQEKVSDLLNNMDSCIKAAHARGKNDITWRPTGIVEEDFAAHKISTLMIYRDKLRQLLAEEEKECDRQRLEVTERRATIDTKLKTVTDCHRRHEANYDTLKKMVHSCAEDLESQKESKDRDSTDME